MMKLIKITLALIALTTFAFPGPPQDDSEYLQPFATLLGSVTNNGWAQSASIEKEFSFSFCMPINLAILSGSDKFYEKSYSSGTYDTTYLSATIFSKNLGATIKEPMYGLDGTILQYMKHHLSDGIKQLGDLPLLPFTTLQFSVTTHYTDIKVRYIGMPEIEGISFHFPGIGVQHDFVKSLIKKELPVDISFLTYYTFPMLNVTPTVGKGEDNLIFETSGVTGFVGVVVGKKFGDFEFFAETGWEFSKLSFVGSQSTNGGNDVSAYNEDLTGRNGFKFALNVAAKIGSWNPVINESIGSNLGNTINLISFTNKK